MKSNLKNIIRLLILIVAFCVFVVPLAQSDGMPDILWRVYTEGSQEKKAVLGECFDRLTKVQEKAGLAAEPLNWSRDPDIQWLLRHHIPIMLIVERELKGRPEGRYLEALIYLTKAIGSRRLSRHLPGLLARVNSTRSQREILRAMSDLRDGESLTALENFLEYADRGISEVLIAEAARGISLTRKKEYLPLIKRVSFLVYSREESERIAAARYRCGDWRMAERLLSVLKDGEADSQLRLWALSFVSENSLHGAVPILAQLARESPEEQLALAAFRALTRVTGYAVPPASELLKGKPSQAPEKPEEDETEGELLLSGRGLEKLSRPEREKLLKRVLDWWEDHKEATPRQGEPITREEALRAPEEDAPH